MPLTSPELPDYESHLLTAMAYFLGRDPEAQARACLCMYLRQAEPRIMAQVRYYAHQLSIHTGQPVEAYDLLTMLAQSPETVTAALPHLGRVHDDSQPDVFSA
ncbi:hypothetical protein [Nodosilinea nodulosa]|uniref:hypothetical protein n=1 Tax=Nodosilinea nodulosa TaxID=416001 RepID=UPI0002FC4E05|nr:hypothetical protein [Nodosilinea nodulosa]